MFQNRLKVAFVILVLFQVLGLIVAQGTPPSTPFFSNCTTKYKYPRGFCQKQCERKAVQDWSAGDWGLYLQLFNEANRRGWIDPLAVEHSNDIGHNLFHGVKEFLPWHRFFIHHYEELLQKVDYDINPGRADRNGEFCLGYWEWGYQTPFSDDFTSDTYRYLFNPTALGTLRSGGIPDGLLAGLNVGGSLVDRNPSLGSNNWGPSAVAACLRTTQLEGFEPNLGFRQCIENGPHASVHNNMGGMFSSFLSPRDPLFFLHHCMVDYTWWLWQNSNANSVPQNWDGPMPRPYDGKGWMNSDALSVGNFCYTYARPRQATNTNPSKRLLKNFGKKLFSTPDGDLTIYEKKAVQAVLDESLPNVVPLEKFNFLTMHARTPEEAQQYFNEHKKAVAMANEIHQTVVDYFVPQIETKKAQLALPQDIPVYAIPAPLTIAAPPSVFNAAAFVQPVPEVQEKVKSCLSALALEL